MPICRFCKKEQTDESVVTCEGRSANLKFNDGEVRAMIPFKSDDPEDRCHDCNVKSGGIHHVGCNVEECPSCGGQVINCPCKVIGGIPT